MPSSCTSGPQTRHTTTPLPPQRVLWPAVPLQPPPPSSMTAPPQLPTTLPPPGGSAQEVLFRRMLLQVAQRVSQQQQHPASDAAATVAATVTKDWRMDAKFHCVSPFVLLQLLGGPVRNTTTPSASPPPAPTHVHRSWRRCRKSCMTWSTRRPTCAQGPTCWPSTQQPCAP